MKDEKPPKEKEKYFEPVKLPDTEESNLPAIYPESSNLKVVEEKERLKLLTTKTFLILWVMITIVSLTGGVVLAFNGNHIIGFIIISFFGVLNYLIVSDLLFNGKGVRNISFSLKEGKFDVNKKENENE